MNRIDCLFLALVALAAAIASAPPPPNRALLQSAGPVWEPETLDRVALGGIDQSGEKLRP